MTMPWQLKVGLYSKRKYDRTEQRPIAETLPHINVNDLNIPRDYKTYVAPNISFSISAHFQHADCLSYGGILSFRTHPNIPLQMD
jgi:hypothetical protein